MIHDEWMREVEKERIGWNHLIHYHLLRGTREAWAQAGKGGLLPVVVCLTLVAFLGMLVRLVPLSPLGEIHEDLHR